MIRQLLLFGCLVSVFAASAQVKLNYENNQTLTYDAVIDGYRELGQNHPNAQLMPAGATDAGRPLNVFLISKDGESNAEKIQASGRRIVLINNGIHPGEPCGVDASLKLARDILEGNDLTYLLDRVVIAIIPLYNIGGSLNRGCCSRANQNGPEMKGFRGNARNLDLNRDFIKADSRNARSFIRLFRELDPDVFIDTHTSNGADYQYTMTLIASQPDKLHPQLAEYMRGSMVKQLYDGMAAKKWDMVPYVHTPGPTPEDGIMDFLETPRYSSGYTAQFNTLGFISETHMFKPFQDRVESTYSLLITLLETVYKDHEKIREVRQQAKAATRTQKRFDLHHKLDTTRFDWIDFKGYEAKTRESEVTGMPRKYYDRNAPFTRKVKYFNRYKATLSVDAPDYYILPQAWKEVIDRLQMNGVKMRRLNKAVDLDVEMYYIDDYKSRKTPYEGHYLHSKVEVRKADQTVHFNIGDYVIPVNQEANRFIVETLEPEGPDSYFAWNFFDGILQQKEWFSDYVFEETAAELLKSDPELKKKYEEYRATSEEDNHWQLLYFIYKHSEWYEVTHNRYPVARFNGELDL